MTEPLTMFSAAEGHVIATVRWLKLSVEVVGGLIITLGVLVAGFFLLRGLVSRRAIEFNAVRLTLSRYLALALEFQLGADILSTAIAPSWDQIGRLGAIAVIRTGLNVFLSREMAEERKQSTAEHETVKRAAGARPAA